MAGGGMMTPTGAPIWENQFSGDDLALVVDAAREAGLPVAAHAHGTDTMATCARAGVDTIEHGSWRTGPTVDPPRFDVRPEVATLIAGAGVPLVPTRARGWPTWAPGDRDGLLARLAWNAERGVEMIVGTSGIGFMMFDARRAGSTVEILLGMIILGLLWYIVDAWILAPLERVTGQRWGLVTS